MLNALLLQSQWHSGTVAQWHTCYCSLLCTAWSWPGISSGLLQQVSCAPWHHLHVLAPPQQAAGPDQRHQPLQVNAFIVRKGSPGFTAKKIENKIALRCVQNADMVFSECFVPDSSRLPGVRSFQDTNKVLAISRVMVAWLPVGMAMGVYDICHRCAWWACAWLLQTCACCLVVLPICICVG